ncbi:GNAT family N-acetyltransferase [Agromyces cerinus]|uniref:Acetyltransferase (GNAT) family protein n=1 Tax=Agromyces cerinus subsp. cerinus TaxID=232089 RepID=A0A1N6DLG9_9MICO|nr:GNAT family N-acetyltransferase [Agromyces cerinus]SIN71659.1 Acetyltransferase (GNAT) family protein [Agromyces cerinus subsp. cerinus]
MTLDIRPVAVPERLGTPEAVEFEAYVEATAVADESVWGHRRFSYDAPELLPEFLDGRYTGRRAFAAWDGGRCVGRADVTWERSDGARAAEITVGVAVDQRRRGIGSELLRHAETHARSIGREVLVGRSDVPVAGLDLPGARLEAPDGTRSIPAADPGAAFATRHGYRLGQLERMSGLTVTGRAAEFRSMLADHLTARDAVAADYRLVGWIDRAPEELLDSLAVAHASMSTDTPAGGISYDEEAWDADRVRSEETLALAGGRTTLAQAAIAPDGAVAGFTELSLPADSMAVFQWDTIVLGPHRGHRLGMLLKLGNLVRLGETAPERTDVYTWNADENDHMLAINIALGFTLRGMSAEWQHD